MRLLGVADSNRFGGSVTGWDDMTSMYSRDAAPVLWSRTGLRPSDVDLALMYDCFTYTVLATFEDFGFCEKGEVGDYFREGRATYGGDVVVNPHGGLLSEGYLHGLNHHFEAVVQLRGDGGERQVAERRRRSSPLAPVRTVARSCMGSSCERGCALHPSATSSRRRLGRVLGSDGSGPARRVPVPVMRALAPAPAGAVPPVRRRDGVRGGRRHRGDLQLRRAAQPVVVGYLEDLPYVVALVELDEQRGLRLPGRVVGAPPDEVFCGMRVAAELIELPGGSYRVPVFRPRYG